MDFEIDNYWDLNREKDNW